MSNVIRCGVRIVAVLTTAMVLGGCAVAAWMTTLSPPDSVPAQYELSEKSTLLVLVEDPGRLTAETALKTELTQQLNREFEDRALVRHVVPYQHLLNLAAATPNFRALSTADVGRKLGADVILYVQIDEFQLKDDFNNPCWHGKLKTLVRVVDIELGRLWPKDLPEGFSPKNVDTGSLAEPASRHFRQKLVRQMALEMAGNITRLFYEHRGEAHGSLPQEDAMERP